MTNEEERNFILLILGIEPFPLILNDHFYIFKLIFPRSVCVMFAPTAISFDSCISKAALIVCDYFDSPRSKEREYFNVSLDVLDEAVDKDETCDCGHGGRWTVSLPVEGQSIVCWERASVCETLEVRRNWN